MARKPVKNTKSSTPQKNRRKPRYMLLFVIFLLSATLCGISVYVYNCEDFVLSKIVVTGTSILEKDRVEAAADYCLGEHSLLISKSTVMSRVESISEVDSVEVWRTWPDQLNIKVTERKPVCVLTDGKSFVMLDSGCFAFHKTSGRVENIPLIVVAGCDGVEVGQTVDDYEVKSAVRTAIEASREHLNVAKISVDHVGDMCLNMDSGFLVRLGQSEQLAEKVTVIRRVLSLRPKIEQEARYLDVSYPEAPVWMPESVSISSVK